MTGAARERADPSTVLLRGPRPGWRWQPRGTGVSRTRRALTRAVLLVGISIGCVAPDADLHLAPLYTHISRAGGGTEDEALAGILRWRRKTPKSPVGEWALRPLVSQIEEPERTTTYFLVPLGLDRRTPDDKMSRLIPIYWWAHTTYDDQTSRWRLIALFSVFGRLPDGRHSFAVFPLGGTIYEFVTWDVVEYFLFPLFAHTQRDGRNAWYVLWPLMNYGQSLGGGHTFRILPFYAENIRPDKYDKRAIMWPLFNKGEYDLDQPPERQTRYWQLWPFFGKKTRGSYQASVVAWPFFGYASDSETGYKAWDGPWPLVRTQKGGANPRPEERRRFWPFWSHFKGDGLESNYYLWPFINIRSESYTDGTRKARYVIPFWQSWDRLDGEGRPIRSWRKLWPLYQDYSEQGRRRLAFPALNPLWPTPVIDDMYAWIYELFTVETLDPGTGQPLWRRERSWGGFWRREVDNHEDRAYLSLLWSRRRARDETGPLTETSLLFGLLRWRSRPGDRFEPMMPALPGPGWPAQRSTLPRQAQSPDAPR